MHLRSRRRRTSGSIAARLSVWSAGAGVALLAVPGCAGGDSAPVEISTNVEVCIDQDATTPAVVEVRQDGDVVGTVILGSGGASAGVAVPPGPVEAYVNDELVGSGELGEGGSIAFSCQTPAPTEPQPEPTSDPAATTTSS